MAQNSAATADGPSETTFDADATIVVDPDEIVRALRNAHEYQRNGREVFTVRPPFDGDCRAKYRFSEAGTYWPPEMHPKPIDLAPETFLDDDRRFAPYPDRNEIRSQMRVDGVELTEENEEEWFDTAVEVWEDDVRSALADEVNINGPYQPPEHVAVCYTTEDENTDADSEENAA